MESLDCIGEVEIWAEVFLVDCVHAYLRHDCSPLAADIYDLKYLILLHQILNTSNCSSISG